LYGWIACAGLFSVSAAAQIQSTDYAIHQQFISVRAVGMGNAFDAVTDDTSAFWYNPAALAYRKDHELKLSLGAGLDTKVLDLDKQINDAKGQPDQTTQINSILNSLNSDMGNYYSVRAPTLGAFFAWPKWQVTFIPADLSIDVSIHNVGAAAANVNGYLDSTLAATRGQEVHWFKDHKIAWGVTVKAVHRVYAGEELFAADLINNSNIIKASDAHEGLTFDADVGTLWTPPVPAHGFFKFLNYMKPTFAFVGHNLVDYGFRTNPHWINGAAGEPPRLGRKFDLGSKFELPQWWVFKNRIAVDEHDMGDDNWTLKKGFHAGYEAYWKMYNWWQGHWSVGFNQGYLGGGVGAKFGWFQFDFATYAEEVGTPSVPQQSRRWMGELALDF
jgi:hypothetical protein